MKIAFISTRRFPALSPNPSIKLENVKPYRKLHCLPFITKAEERCFVNICWLFQIFIKYSLLKNLKKCGKSYIFTLLGCTNIQLITAIISVICFRYMRTFTLRETAWLYFEGLNRKWRNTVCVLTAGWLPEERASDTCCWTEPNIWTRTPQG